MSDVEGVNVPSDTLQILVRDLKAISEVIAAHDGINEPYHAGQLDQIASIMESWL
jgi:hypothetical protein